VTPGKLLLVKMLCMPTIGGNLEWGFLKGLVAGCLIDPLRFDILLDLEVMTPFACTLFTCT